MGVDVEDGLNLILSPVQLAAVMQGRTISQADTQSNRFVARAFGALEIIGGAMELVASGALILTLDPTFATKIGGAAVALHGSDVVSTGAMEFWTGLSRTTLTHKAAAAAARNIGLSPDVADTAGVAVDILVPSFAAAGFKAVRILAIREGLIDLVAEEAAGGHTIAKHVGKDEKWLRDRLAREPHIMAAGSFRKLAHAEKFVSKALKQNSAQVQVWSSSPNMGVRFEIVYDAGETVGLVVLRSTNLAQDTSRMIVRLKRVYMANKTYYIATSYPVP